MKAAKEEEDKRILSEMEKLPADEYVERLADAIEEKLPSEALEALRGGTAVVTHAGTAYPPNSALVQEECSLILTEEGKVQLAESMQRVMQRRKQELARERAATPLCHLVLHPFLGTRHFKDTCPECGWKAVKEEECPKKEPSGSST